MRFIPGLTYRVYHTEMEDEWNLIFIKKLDNVLYFHYYDTDIDEIITETYEEDLVDRFLNHYGWWEMTPDPRKCAEPIQLDEDLFEL